MSNEYKHVNNSERCERKDGCRIVINNILVCSDNHKKFTNQYEVDKDFTRYTKDNKEYKLDKKGITIVNKFNCGKCNGDGDCDDDDDD